MEGSPITIFYPPFGNDSEKVAIVNGIVALLSEDLFLDTTISVEGQLFKSNQLFLSSISPFFKSMYTSGFQESVDGKVVLGDVTSKIFEQIEEFLMNDFTIELGNMEDVLELLVSACQLQIMPLVNAITTFFEDVLVRGFYTKYLSWIWKLTRLHGLFSLERVCMDLIRVNFTKVDPACLDFEEMKTLLTDKNIQLGTCLEPSQLVIDWIWHDPIPRIKYLPDLASCLLFEDAEALLKDGDFMFKDVLKKHRVPIENSTDSSTDLAVISALQNEDPDKKGLRSELKTFVRNEIKLKQIGCYENLDTRNVSVTIVLQDMNAGIIPCIYDTEPGSMGLYGILIDPKFEADFLLVRRAACVYEESKLFVSGGISNRGVLSNSMYMFDNDTGVWKKCASMKEPRCGHSMYASPLTGSVFVFRGRADQTIFDYEEYSITEDKWVNHGTTDLLEQLQQYDVYPCSFREYAVFFVIEDKPSPNDPFQYLDLDSLKDETKIIEFDYETREFEVITKYDGLEWNDFVEQSVLITEDVFIYSVSHSMKVRRWGYNCPEVCTPSEVCEVLHSQHDLWKAFGLELKNEKLYIRGGLGHGLISRPTVVDDVTVVDCEDELQFVEGYKARYTPKYSTDQDGPVLFKKMPKPLKGAFWARMYIKRKWIGKKFVFEEKKSDNDNT